MRSNPPYIAFDRFYMFHYFAMKYTHYCSLYRAPLRRLERFLLFWKKTLWLEHLHKLSMV